ncbi:MAG: tRNA (adenosine(37)-N6)-threonylcarbamoyltransferase complex dimerization subunit type 1 TsaB [Verrucomicrobiota bacterium]
MQVLALETSTSMTSWSASINGKIVAGEELEGPASFVLTPSIANHLDQEMRFDLILVGVGPGSFAGIRAGIATAQGLAQGWNADIKSVMSTHALGLEYRQVSFLGIFGDARRGKVVFTAYEKGVYTRPPQLIDPAELDHHLSKCSLAVSTDGLPGVPGKACPKSSYLIDWFHQYGADLDLALEPVYLHPPMSVPKS